MLLIEVWILIDKINCDFEIIALFYSTLCLWQYYLKPKICFDARA